MVEARHYVYALLDPRRPGDFKYSLPCGRLVTFDYEPFYIGKGAGSRAYQHTYEAKVGKRPGHKANKILKIQEDGFDIIVRKCKGRFGEAEALSLERELITVIGRTASGTGPLTNHRSGGHENSGYVKPEDIRQRNRKSSLKMWASLTPDQRASRTEAVRIGLSRMTAEDKIRWEASKRAAKDALPEEAERLRVERMRKSKLLTPNLTCPTCGKEGKPHVMSRWHFDNCKHLR